MCEGTERDRVGEIEPLNAAFKRTIHHSIETARHLDITDCGWKGCKMLLYLHPICNSPPPFMILTF